MDHLGYKVVEYRILALGRLIRKQNSLKYLFRLSSLTQEYVVLIQDFTWWIIVWSVLKFNPLLLSIWVIVFGKGIKPKGEI